MLQLHLLADLGIQFVYNGLMLMIGEVEFASRDRHGYTTFNL
jgi:hypothetical protein